MLDFFPNARDKSGQSGQPHKRLELSVPPLVSRLERTRDKSWGHVDAPNLNSHDITLIYPKLDCAAKHEPSMSPAEALAK
jgi:hypothetical protein